MELLAVAVAALILIYNYIVTLMNNYFVNTQAIIIFGLILLLVDSLQLSYSI